MMEYHYMGTKPRLSRLPYYILSLKVIYNSIDRLYKYDFLYDLLFSSPFKKIHLKKNNLIFQLKTWLDILTLKEVVLDDEYQNHGVVVEQKDRVIVDIGAGFGDFSIMIARKFPQAKIFAFEPDSLYFSLLLENIRLNGVKNVFPFLFLDE